MPRPLSSPSGPLLIPMTSPDILGLRHLRAQDEGPEARRGKAAFSTGPIQH